MAVFGVFEKPKKPQFLAIFAIFAKMTVFAVFAKSQKSRKMRKSRKMKKSHFCKNLGKNAKNRVFCEKQKDFECIFFAFFLMSKNEFKIFLIFEKSHFFCTFSKIPRAYRRRFLKNRAVDAGEKNFPEFFFTFSTVELSHHFGKLEKKKKLRKMPLIFRKKMGKLMLGILGMSPL